jgi:NAD(P)H dehydrogenase (quinone)
MVKYLLLVCHPESKSFNYGMHNAAKEALVRAGHEVKVTDIQGADHFNPTSGRHNYKTVKDANYFKQQFEEMHAVANHGFADDIEAEARKLEWADVVIFQFPLWWFSFPAPMKGWCDRVLAMNRFYGGGKFYENGILKGKKAVLSLTTGGPEQAYIKNGFNGDIMGVLRPIHRGILQFCGMTVLKPEIVYAAAHLTDEQRHARIEEWKARVVQLHTEAPIEVGQY